MQDYEKRLLEIIRKSPAPEAAIRVAVKVILGFLEQLQSSE